MNKSLLITGSNAGIGLKTAKLFAEKGWKVAATMRSTEKAGELADLSNVQVYKLDVSSTSSVQQATKQCIADFGSIDVVVNNAGFGVYGAVEITTEDQVDRQFDVNVKGVIRVMKSFLPHFRSRGEGLFVNVSSIAGLTTYPLGALYNSSKWALEGLTEGMHFELRPQGVRVKLVEPGSFGTSFQQVGLEWTKHTAIDVYDEMINKIRGKRESIQSQLADPIAVAKKIYEAANDPSERLRYLVGEDAEAYAARRLEIGSEAYVAETYEKMKVALDA